MRRMPITDAFFLIMESRRTPMHVGGLNLFTLPKDVDDTTFLSHLGDMVPDSLVLLNANVVREDTHWTIELTGTTNLPFDQAPAAFALLESRLAEPPWNAEITRSWQDAWMEQLKSGGAAMDGTVGFHMTGRLR